MKRNYFQNQKQEGFSAGIFFIIPCYSSCAAASFKTSTPAPWKNLLPRSQRNRAHCYRWDAFPQSPCSQFHVRPSTIDGGACANCQMESLLILDSTVKRRGRVRMSQAIPVRKGVIAFASLRNKEVGKVGGGAKCGAWKVQAENAKLISNFELWNSRVLGIFGYFSVHSNANFSGWNWEPQIGNSCIRGTKWLWILEVTFLFMLMWALFKWKNLALLITLP